MGEESASRLSGFGTSIFTEITSLAAKHKAVNLGQGFPDFPAPTFIKEAAARHIREDRNQYAPSAGVPEDPATGSAAAAFAGLFVDVELEGIEPTVGPGGHLDAALITCSSLAIIAFSRGASTARSWRRWR